MLTKIDGRKFTLSPKTPKENERLCEVCGGTGWLLDEENGFIEKCKCNNGVINICERCGRDLKYGLCQNSDCQRERYREKEIQMEKNRVVKAKHYILDNCPKEYTEMFYSDMYHYNNGYSDDVDWIDSLDEDDRPKYVWGTSKQKFTLDAYDFISRALEESYEDAFDHVREEELAKLQTACDKFIKAHNGGLDSYCVNYNVCIDLEVE